ncbi:MAG: hypothetical protein V7704_08290 [Aurantimonas endophytica]|uniref:hypothetical protein n=1 Tax=Aurantimonas endophytica TaxID=1522175 RepID=UPI0030034F5B
MKTLREARAGKATVRIVKTAEGYAAIVFDGKERLPLIEGDDADDVWRRAHDAAGQLSPHFVGYDGARKRFHRYFPDGFTSDFYLRHERTYKLEAKRKLDETVPLAAAASGRGDGIAVLRVYQATNLLSPFEKAKLSALLRSEDSDEFIRLAAAFAEGDEKGSLADLKLLLRPYDSGKWTVVTYLPFLWKPDEHVFLKPTMIHAFAERVGHPFAHVYRPDLDIEVYRSLQDLAQTTREKIADLEPVDMIDVQSFMWTAVEYNDAVA